MLITITGNKRHPDFPEKPIQLLSHNHKDRKTHQKPHTPRLS